MSLLRRATAADANAVGELYIRTRSAAAPAIPPMAHDHESVLGHFARLVDSREVWVAEHEGQLVGLLVREDDWIDQLYVDPVHQGRGIGTELVLLAQRERPERLQLWAFQSNLGALRFYARHGFAEAERTDGSTNEERSPDVRLVWTG